MPLTKDKLNKIGDRIQYHLEEYKKSIFFNCRVNPDPTQSWDEVGCPHKHWTEEELRDALITAKAINKIYFDVLYPGNIAEVRIEKSKEPIPQMVYQIYELVKNKEN